MTTYLPFYCVRCNYIDVNIDTLKSWGEWRVAQLTGAADWFKLRIPYDCSSLVHYYQLQGAFWKEHIGMRELRSNNTYIHFFNCRGEGKQIHGETRL